MEVLSLRILVVSDVSAEFVHGGAERMLFHHLRALKKAGHKVTALTRQPNKDSKLSLKLKHLDIEEQRLPFSGDKGYQGLKQLEREAKAWWKSHGESFDCLVSEQPFVMWSLLKAGCKLPRLQVCYSFAFEEYETRYGLSLTWKNKLVIASMRRLEKRVYESARQRLVLSKFSKDRFETFFGIKEDKVSVAAGAAEPAIALEHRDSFREALGWEKPVIITLRNLVPRTGVDLMIQAAAIIKAKGKDVSWVVMGDGVLNEPMQRMVAELDVADVVEFTGFLSEPEVQKRLCAADVFMLPTRGLEGFGLVTLEANGCGLPVLATPVSANTELVPTIKHNQLSDNASPAALADKLLWMLEHPISLAQRQQVRDDSIGQYNWEKHDKVFVDLVEHLI